MDTTTAPYHPASNGLAERVVGADIEEGPKEGDICNMYSRLAKLLFHYGITPQTTTGTSPAELLLGRKPRTCLDLLKPNTAERVKKCKKNRKPDTTRRLNQGHFVMET